MRPHLDYSKIVVKAVMVARELLDITGLTSPYNLSESESIEFRTAFSRLR